MRTTPRESSAAQRLAESLLEFIIAMEQGMAERRAAQQREQIAPRLHPSPPEGLKQEPLLLSAHEAAERLGISERTLFSMSVPTGPIPKVRIGTRILYAVADLDMVIERLKLRPK